MTTPHGPAGAEECEDNDCAGCGWCAPNVPRLEPGTLRYVSAHKSAPGKGLSYPAMVVTLIDPCETEGWDVIDVRLDDGREASVYSFSVLRCPYGRGSHCCAGRPCSACTDS